MKQEADEAMRTNMETKVNRLESRRLEENGRSGEADDSEEEKMETIGAKGQGDLPFISF